MNFKRNLRKAAELGVGLSALSALILAGCGGGGGNSASSSGTNGNNGASATTMNVTPGKGVMIGAEVTIKDANGSVLGRAATTSAGVAAVSIPPTAMAPFVVSVNCPSTCQYFDEKTMTMHSGASNMPPLLAVVPSVNVANVGVSAATHAAAQYAMASGVLTPATVTTANNMVVAQLGLTGVADILTPPRIISDAASLALAKSDATDADKLAHFSATLAQAASGVTAIEAIAAYGDSWKQAALTPASGVILPPSINLAVVTQNAPAIIVAPPNIASAVAAQTQQVAAEIAAVNHMLADASATGGGLREWFPSVPGPGTTMLPNAVHTHVLSATGGNTYSGVSSYKELAATGWIALSSNFQPSSYSLTASGWQIYDQADTFVNNLNGTVTTTSISRGVVTEHVTETVLDGQPIVCTDPVTAAAVACAVPGNYPVGSKRYGGTGGKASVDNYRIWANDAYYTNTVTDLNGVALTALPAAGAGFCSNGLIFTPILNAAAGADNYNVYLAGKCTSAFITAGTMFPAAGTVRLSTKATGNSVVPTVGIASAAVTSPVSFVNNAILAVVTGKVMEGNFRPAGSNASRVFYVNKTALDAELVANGLPSTAVAGSAPATGAASGVAAVASLMADATAGSWIGNWTSVSGVGAASAVANATVSTAVQTAANTYTVTDTSKTLAAGVWALSTATPLPGNPYILGVNGWQPWSNPRSFTVVDNGNGTISIAGNGTAASGTVTKTDVSGLMISCVIQTANGIVPVCPGAVGIYPAGSSLYTMSTTVTANEYFLVDNPLVTLVLTDGAGVALANLPAAGTRFCVSGQVYDPIAGAAAGADNYRVVSAFDSVTLAPSCAAADITAAVARTSTITALVSQQPTGNAVVPTVGLAQYKASGVIPAHNVILAFNLGKVMTGVMNATGTVQTQQYWNRTALNAQLTAYALTTLP